MTCPQCNEYWCWQCGDWGGGPSGRPQPHHVWNCNDPVNTEWHGSLDVALLFGDKARYKWHHDRYINHLDSLHFAAKLRETVREMCAQMQGLGDFNESVSQLIRE